jgi:glycosyltransferase involved in cell wall biosynthesis
MKILFLTDTFKAGGKERRLIELMKGLKLNPEVQFEIVIMDEVVHYKELFDLEIKIHYIVRRSKKDISVFYKIYKLCKTYKPDVVHCWDSMTAVYLIPAAKLLRLKFVNGMVADAPQNQNFRNKVWLRGKLTFPFSTIIVGNSKAGLLAYGAPKRKSVCINNGFNFKRTESLQSPDFVRRELGIQSGFVIGMVASFSVFKDYKTYFTAAQIVLKRRRDVVFLAIGTDTDSVTFKENISNEFKENFRFLGKRTDIEALINAMDICVLSTFTEGISNSILEYMSLGKPVIATDGGGTNEIVVDQITGFLVTVSDSIELAERIEILLNNESLRRKMGIEGKKRIENNFSINKMVDAFTHTYTKLISK